MDAIPNGTIPDRHDPEWTQSRMDTIPNGHNPNWTRSQVNTIPNGHIFEWIRSQRIQSPKILKFCVAVN